MGECINHAGTPAVATCEGCAEQFCGNCLVALGGKHFCASCKGMAATSGGRASGRLMPCEEAGEALKYAIVGIFCFGIILGPMAISKAINAKKMMAANPNLTGEGKANTAMVIGILVLVLWFLGLAARIGART